MKKVIYITLLLMLAGILPLKAQLNMTLRTAVALPGKPLKEQGYPTVGASFGMGAHYALVNTKPFRFDVGAIFDIIQCGSKTYSFGNDRNRFYNSNFTADINTRIIFNTFRLKPYVSIGYGYLESSTNEEFYTVNNSDNSNTNKLSTRSTWNSSLGVGLLMEVKKGFNIDFSVTHYIGGNNTFIDFNTVTSDNNFVYVNPKNSSVYDMLLIHLGLVIDLDFSNSTSTTYSSSTSNSTSGSFRVNGSSRNNGSSRRYTGPKR